MSSIAVINKQARVQHIGCGYTKAPGEGGSLTIEKIDLIPGVNVVDAEKWERAKAQPGTAHLLDNDLVKEGPKCEAGPLGLAKVKNEIAVKLVAQTLDLDQLAEWKLGEKRPEVLSEIAYQESRVEAESKGEDPPARKKIKGRGR